MRVNLNCPYAEKDAAKRLGARWDADKKVWYVVDPPDLLVFSRWLRAYPAQDKPPPAAKRQAHKPKSNKHKPQRCKSRPIVEGQVFAVTGGEFAPLCDCDVLPWEDCEHTDALAEAAMLDQLSLAEMT